MVGEVGSIMEKYYGGKYYGEMYRVVWKRSISWGNVLFKVRIILSI
jgi:hypothetical protein